MMGDIVISASLQLMRNALSQKVLEEELRRYAFWAGPRSHLVMTATALLGWRISRTVRQKLGRPQGALYWPMGLGLLSLNSRSCLLGSFHANVIEQAISGLERKPLIHVDSGGVLYAALAFYERLEDAGGVARIQRLAQQFLRREGAQDGEITYAPDRDEVLIDTLGMICPMLARVGRMTGDERYTALAHRQLNTFLHRAFDEQSGWLWHGYHRLSGVHLGDAGWGRGMGWLMIGMVDTLRELPDGQEKNALAVQVETWLTRLAQVQG